MQNSIIYYYVSQDFELQAIETLTDVSRKRISW